MYGMNRGQVTFFAMMMSNAMAESHGCSALGRKRIL